MTDTTNRAPSAQRSVLTTRNYAAAERAVDRLSDKGFPVERASIVGSDLRYVENVTGRLTTGKAALTGAGQGASIGLFVAAFISLFFDLSTGSFFGWLAYGLVSGAVFGAAYSALFHALQGGRRDFSAMSRTEADHYELIVDDDLAQRAEALLAP